jgi:hypothetical protein
LRCPEARRFAACSVGLKPAWLVLLLATSDLSQPSTKLVKPANFKFKHKGKRQVPPFSSFGAKPINIHMKLTT